MALESRLIHGEIAEACARRLHEPDAGGELGGVALAPLLDEMTGIDLQGEVEGKLARNAVRVHRRDETTGALTPVAQDAPPYDSVDRPGSRWLHLRRAPYRLQNAGASRGLRSPAVVSVHSAALRNVVTRSGLRGKQK